MRGGARGRVERRQATKKEGKKESRMERNEEGRRSRGKCEDEKGETVEEESDVRGENHADAS